MNDKKSYATAQNVTSGRAPTLAFGFLVCSLEFFFSFNEIVSISTVKPAVAVTCIKRDPPLSGHFRVPRTILNANAPLLSVHLSNAASGRRNLPQNAEIVSVTATFHGSLRPFD